MMKTPGGNATITILFCLSFLYLIEYTPVSSSFRKKEQAKTAPVRHVPNLTLRPFPAAASYWACVKGVATMTGLKSCGNSLVYISALALDTGEAVAEAYP